MELEEAPELEEKFAEDKVVQDASLRPIVQLREHIQVGFIYQEVVAVVLPPEPEVAGDLLSQCCTELYAGCPCHRKSISWDAHGDLPIRARICLA